MTAASSSVGPYELLRPLGEGGMAETFVAVRRGPADFEQRVCLKRILPQRAENPVFVELFLDEARLLGRLQCRNIVHVYDFGNASGTYYMALELVDGLDLAKLLASLRGSGRRISLGLALHIFAEVLSALSYAHTLVIDGEPQGIVHRDISPSNILISRNGEVKLTDFGIAKARGRLHQTQTGHVKGKVAYMSPEQIKAGELDGRSDLFSLGIVLFELLTGTHPFDSDTDFAIQLSIIAGKRPTLAGLRPDLPAAVVTLLDMLLATEPAQRPATAQAALALLPAMESSFTLQQKLAALVDQRHEGTTEDATQTPLPARAAPPTAEEWAKAAQSERPAALPSARAVAPLATAAGSSKGFNKALFVAPLLVLIVTGVAYAWFSRAGRAPPGLPSLSAIRGESSAREPAHGAPETTRRVGSGTAQAIEEVVSPAKGGVRPRPQSVESVVSPAKREPPPPAQPTQQVISPAKSSPPPKTQPLDAVVSPAKGPPAKADAIERVVSPPKGAAPKAEPVDVVISPRK